MSYKSPLAEYRFLLDHITPVSSLREHWNELGIEIEDALMEGAARLAEEKLAPLNRISDTEGARFEGGQVITPKGYASSWKAISENGWLGLCAGEAHGGLNMPQFLGAPLSEMGASSCLALNVMVLLQQGQIEALEAHGSEEQKALYLPKLISGEWSGTMNLTEPEAGSDVGALRSRAEPQEDGSFNIFGQKIYISFGDTDFLNNTIHLVLARLPDAPKGSGGISLFLVPKFLPDENGEPGERNALEVLSIEHKLGIHGSPTCVMSYNGAKGWLVGKANRGLAAMFTMMNNARLGVALQGVGIAEAALQKAYAYAQERIQGRVLSGRGSTIAHHADIRLSLTSMRAKTFAARAIAFDCARLLDLAKAGDHSASAKAAFMIPIAKSFGTDVGIEAANEGIQIHGGMGFIEETGAAQYWRDARITAIYEGTNGIQAMDLVGRKLGEKGEVAQSFVDSMREEAAGSPLEVQLNVAATKMQEATAAMLNFGLDDRFAGARDYLRAVALSFGLMYHSRAARVEHPRLKLAEFYALRIFPEAEALFENSRLGAQLLHDVEDSILCPS